MVDTIYVARHGLRANQEPPPTGIDGDPRLTAEGDIQAVELAKFLSKDSEADHSPITAIYSSPFYRCLQTATPASKLFELPIWVETGLGEYYGRTRPTKPVPWPASRSKPIFNTIDLSYHPQIAVSVAGESREDLGARALNVLNAILAHADNNGIKTIFLVTHAAVKIAIGEVLSGTTGRAGTCSLDKYVRNNDEDRKYAWRCVMSGETSFLSGGEQMHWSFDMAYEAGSLEDEASRLPASERVPHFENGTSVKSLVPVDLSALSPQDQPETLDPSQMFFTRLDTDRPIVQIGSRIYEGQWQLVIGTEVFTSNVGEALGSARHRLRLLPAELDSQREESLREQLAEARKANL